MADDYLAKLSEVDVASFYRRLALSIQKRFDGDSLAATLLLHWLGGSGAKKIFPARYVSDLSWVREHLRDVARPVFLSKRAAPDGTFGGVVPRLKGTIKTTPQSGPYKMHLDRSVEASLTVQAQAAAGMLVEPRELDALYALHGFHVISDVEVTATASGARSYNVRFTKWTCHTTDRYHWNPDKSIKVPNPDYGSKEPSAIAPNDKSVQVFHKNAIRLEKAGLAKEFENESEPWEERTDLMVVGPATVNI
jgi:hypothetical protein